jgi:hypothetical protein
VASNVSDRDIDIVRLNSLGLSLSTIAAQLGCHTTTITNRLAKLNIPPADTRRAFMEDIIDDLSSEQTVWLSNQLGPRLSIKDYIKNLITKEFLNS